MKNITLSADERVIAHARLRAQAEHKTLNALFREWLERYAEPAVGAERYAALMKRLGHVRSGGVFTRDERNER